MRMRAALVVAATALALAACGSGSGDGSGSATTSAVPVTTTVTDVADSSYLGDVVSDSFRAAAIAPTESGLLVIGGRVATYEQPIVPVDDAVIVRADGSVAVLPPPPGGSMASISVSAFGDVAYVVGTECVTGTRNDDTSALACEPGTPALARLDLPSATWTALDLPADAPEPGGFDGDQTVYAVDGALVYQVAEAMSGGDRVSSWITSDDGAAWTPMPAEPDGAYCAADGELLYFATGERLSDPDEPGAVRAGNTPDTPLSVTVRTYDLDDADWGPVDEAPGDFDVVAGATSVSCLPDTGAVAFTLTGGTAGAIVVYTVQHGWRIVHDDEGARMMSALPSWGSGILVPRTGSDDLVRIDAAGERNTVKLPASSQAYAGIGDAVLIRNADGNPEVVEG